MSFLQSILGGRRRAADVRERAKWLDRTTRQAVALVADNLAAQHGQRRSFASTERPAWVASMPTSVGAINDDLANKLPTMRGTAKAAARNNEWARRYLKALPDMVLGPNGVALHMTAKLPGSDQLDTAANTALESFWLRWCQRGACEVSGRYNWPEVEELLLGALPRSGEFLLRHRFGAGPMGYQVQVLPAELIDVSLRRDWQGRRVRMGIELTDDGTFVAAWLRAHKAGEATPEDGTTQVGQHLRIPADQLVHGFEAEEVDQLRGIPWLDAGARGLWLLGEFQESVNVASGNAAKREGFFTSATGEAPPIADTIVSTVLEAARAQGKVLSTDELEQLTAAATKYSTTMPGQYDTLPHGYDFKPYDSKWPDVAADAHIKSYLRAWASARGMSYHTLGNDLADVNYSSAQVGIADERAHFARVQQRFIGWLHQRVWPHVLQQALLREADLKPTRRDAYLAGTNWQPPVARPIDPLKSAEADDVQLRNRSTSRRRIWIGKGLDPDEMQRELLAEEAIFGRLDAAAQATKPAAPQG